jgi:hypothetical protein
MSWLTGLKRKVNGFTKKIKHAVKTGVDYTTGAIKTGFNKSKEIVKGIPAVISDGVIWAADTVGKAEGKLAGHIGKGVREGLGLSNMMMPLVIVGGLFALSYGATR